MRADGRTVAITGANGFIGRNLEVRLGELGIPVRAITRATADVRAALAEADVVVHLAGTNRPDDPAEFMRSNRDHTVEIADAIAAGGRRPLVIGASSAKAADGSDYGQSKRAGEAALLGLAVSGAARVAVYRLPNVFGKWARPHHNSAVATFCHNIARDIPIRIDEASAPLALLHIDDLIDQWIALMMGAPVDSGFIEPVDVHHSTVGEIAALIRGFALGRSAGHVSQVGQGLERALYATFVSALPEEAFSYPLAVHADARGQFVEVLKTPSSGQFSCFTAHPGVTRGGHYHHCKVEKFLVVHGEALFRFRHILDGITHEIRTTADHPVVVESIPGWTHDVTNVGEEVMVSLVWANELFDRDRPDTMAMPL